VLVAHGVPAAFACLGLLPATVGRDGFVSAERFTFESLSLADGLDFVPVAMGLFGLGEILYALEERHRAVRAPAKVTNVWPSRADLRQARGAIGRGSIIGFVLGVLPGGGAVLASLTAYAIEKRRSRTPERFGQGAVEGVAAPETANNAAATSSFIPLLTLGIPANATMAVIFGALLIQGVTPGPQLVTENPELFWGVINSMYLGDVLLLIMSIPLVGMFVRSLLLFDGDPTGFFTRGISGTLLACFIAVALLPAARSVLRRRKPATPRAKEPV